METRKITDLTQKTTLSDDAEFIFVDVGETSGPDAGPTGQTSRITFGKLKENGLEGPTGPTGGVGPKGEPGAPGSDGVNGTNGLAGANGEVGQLCCLFHLL